MILNNYWNWIKNIQQHANGSSGQYETFRNITGGYNTVNFGGTNSYYVSNYSLANDAFARFGSSTTEPSASDYCLADDITANITNSSLSYAFECNNNIKRTLLISGHNSGANEITIRQVGIGKQLSYGGSDTKASFLFAVCVLSTPLTVPSGSDFAITLEWVES